MRTLFYVIVILSCKSGGTEYYTNMELFYDGHTMDHLAVLFLILGSLKKYIYTQIFNQILNLALILL